VMQFIAQLGVQLGKETVRDQCRRRSINSWFALGHVRLVGICGGDNIFTCPPEKPTATTPSSSGFVRNFGLIIEVVVIVLAVGKTEALDVEFSALWCLAMVEWRG